MDQFTPSFWLYNCLSLKIGVFKGSVYAHCRGQLKFAHTTPKLAMKRGHEKASTIREQILMKQSYFGRFSLPLP